MRRPVCLAGLAFMVFLWIYLQCRPAAPPSLEEWDAQTVVLSGTVTKKEHRISNGQEILAVYLKDIQIISPQSDETFSTAALQSVLEKSTEDEAAEILASGISVDGLTGVLCYMADGEEAKMGSRVCVSGKFRVFSSATNPGEFDSQSYYETLRLQARLTGTVNLSESSTYNRYREELWQFREYLGLLIDHTYSEKDASVMKAMLLGEKGLLESETKQLYQANGIIHILSISGLHISLLGMGLYRMLKKYRCPRAVCALLPVAVMISYGLMTGMAVSALRAICMFCIRMGAGILHRTYDMLTALAVAGILVLAGQPLYLYYSGFLFSFGALLAIGLFAPILEKMIAGRSKLSQKAASMLSAGLSVSLVTLPVYLYFYFEYPLYSVLLNLLIVPSMTLLMADGLLGLSAAALWLPFGRIVTFPVHILLLFYEKICTLTLQIPGSRCILGQPALWRIVIFAIILIALAAACTKLHLADSRQDRRKYFLQKSGFWAAVFAAVCVLVIRLPNGLQLTMIDVGQGESIYLADDDGGHYLIDGGSSSKSDVGTYQIIPFLKSQGAGSLDAVFITHMDSDHYNGLTTLLEESQEGGIQIKNLILPDIGEGTRDDTYHMFEELAQAGDIPVTYLHTGESLSHGHLSLTCLYPFAGAEGDSNELSMVLYLEYGDFTALLTGDLEGTGEENVLAELLETPSMQNVTVLGVAHHGSRNSTSAAFLEAVSPQIALISAGVNNSYGHPHAETIERLSDAGCLILQTPQKGAVSLYYRGETLTASYFLEDSG